MIRDNHYLYSNRRSFLLNCGESYEGFGTSYFKGWPFPMIDHPFFAPYQKRLQQEITLCTKFGWLYYCQSDSFNVLVLAMILQCCGTYLHLCRLGNVLAFRICSLHLSASWVRILLVALAFGYFTFQPECMPTWLSKAGHV